MLCQAQSAGGFSARAKGRPQTALAKFRFRLMDYFGLESKIQNPCKPMIALVAGGGFVLQGPTHLRMNNEETGNTIFDKERNSEAGDTQEVHKPRFGNPDNHDLWRWDTLPDGGDAPEVNGHWADEIQGFVPTSGELLVLAEHWTSVRSLIS